MNIAPNTGLWQALQASLPNFDALVAKGTLAPNAPLANYSWFRAGGAAEVLFLPSDEAELALVLRALPAHTPITVLGLGSNIIIRDGGVAGLVVRLGGRGFGALALVGEMHIKAGAGVPDVKLARFAADHALAGLAFYRGIPGSIGGAVKMNAGAHGGETKDVLIEAYGITYRGESVVLSLQDLAMTYRHSSVPEDVIITGALFQGIPGEQAEILAQMEEITQKREASQPIREKTGGSTFKNPPGHKAWQLIDAAGCRGLALGDAQVSDMHCNFLINRGMASASEIEALGEEVCARVLAHSGMQLEWEIKRVGIK